MSMPGNLVRGFTAFQATVGGAALTLAALHAAGGGTEPWRHPFAVGLLGLTGASLLWPIVFPPTSTRARFAVLYVLLFVAAVNPLIALQAHDLISTSRPDVLLLALPGIAGWVGVLRAAARVEDGAVQALLGGSTRFAVGLLGLVLVTLVLLAINVVFVVVDIALDVLVHEVAPDIGWVGPFLRDPLPATLIMMPLTLSTCWQMAVPPNRPFVAGAGTDGDEGPVLIGGLVTFACVAGAFLLGHDLETLTPRDGLPGLGSPAALLPGGGLLLDRNGVFEVALILSLVPLSAWLTALLVQLPPARGKVVRADERAADRHALRVRFAAATLVLIAAGASCWAAYERDRTRYVLFKADGIELADGGEDRPRAFAYGDVERVEVTCARPETQARLGYALIMPDATPIPLVRNRPSASWMADKALGRWASIDDRLRAEGVPVVPRPMSKRIGAAPRYDAEACAEIAARLSADDAETILRLLTPDP